MLEGIEVIQTQSKAVADFYCEGGGAKFDLAVFLNQIARFVKRFYEAKKVSSIGIQFWIYRPESLACLDWIFHVRRLHDVLPCFAPRQLNQLLSAINYTLVGSFHDSHV